MPELSLDDIKDWQQFEELIAAYFRCLSGIPEANIISIIVQPPGVGQDGGKDMIVEFTIPDLIKAAKRKWLIQCKYGKGSISTDALSDINIPTLIHSYGACGYLLILRGRPTNKLVEYFRRLSETCRDKYHYEIWSGEMLKEKLISAPRNIHQLFFPKFYDELSSLEKKSKE